MFFVLVHGFAEWTGVVMKITEREISLCVSPKQKFSKIVGEKPPDRVCCFFCCNLSMAGKQF